MLKRIPLLVILLLIAMFNGCKRNFDTLVVTLFENIEKGNLAEVKSALEKHPQLLGYENDRAHEMLAYTIENGRTEIAHYLILKHVDVQSQAPIGQLSSLHIASQYGRKDIIEILISHGASLASMDGSGGTPLHYACMTSYHKGVVELLVSKGADVNVKNRSGQTPLHAVALCSFDEDGCSDAVDVLIKSGADVNSVDIYGYTPLAYALELGHDKKIKVLKAFGGSLGKEGTVTQYDDIKDDEMKEYFSSIKYRYRLWSEFTRQLEQQIEQRQKK